ncbi:MAG: uroporphyrin-3 C-methyltransferase [Phenylobacterium sp.]|jgi:uroporphyrin-3 C-methyltransferase
MMAEQQDNAPSNATTNEQTKQQNSSMGDNESTTVEPQAPAKSAKQPGRLIAWLGLLCALVALAGLGGGYWFWQQQQLAQQQQFSLWQQQQTTEQQQFTEQITLSLTESLTGQINTLKAQQQQAQSGVQQRLSDQVNAMEGRISEVAGRRPNDWVLAEANYLIRMAGRKLWLEDDLITAQHLLATADVRISELNDPSLYPLRKVISEDIATIRALPHPPVSDIHLALSGLIELIDGMAINSLDIQRLGAKAQDRLVSEPVNDSGNELADDYQNNFLKSLKDFASRLLYINGGVNEGDIEPLKMPRQQWYLRANLKMALLQAQVAVLSRDQAVFRDTVTRAISWLEHFKPGDSTVLATKTSLEAMLNHPIDAQYPEQFVSQKVMNELLLDRLGNAYQVRQPAPAPKVEAKVEAKPATQQDVQPEKAAQSEQGEVL